MRLQFNSFQFLLTILFSTLTHSIWQLHCKINTHLQVQLGSLDSKTKHKILVRETLRVELHVYNQFHSTCLILSYYKYAHLTLVQILHLWSPQFPAAAFLCPRSLKAALGSAVHCITTSSWELFPPHLLLLGSTLPCEDVELKELETQLSHASSWRQEQLLWGEYFHGSTSWYAHSNHHHFLKMNREMQAWALQLYWCCTHKVLAAQWRLV